MAIAYDTYTQGKNWVSANSWTFAHTCTGSNRFLAFGFMGSAAGDSVTGATYNGTAMTRLNTGNDWAGSNRFYTYYIANPDSGSNNIVISSSATVNASIISSSFTGVHQTTPIDSNKYDVGRTNSSNTFTLTTTVVGSNCWLVAYWRDVDGGYSPDSGTNGTTDRGRTTTVAMVASDSNGTVGTGSQGLKWDAGGNSRIGALMIFSLAPDTTPSRADTLRRFRTHRRN